MKNPTTPAAVQLYAINAVKEAGLEWPEAFTKNAMTDEYEKAAVSIARAARILFRKHPTLSKLLAVAAKRMRELERAQKPVIQYQDEAKRYHRQGDYELAEECKATARGLVRKPIIEKHKLTKAKVQKTLAETKARLAEDKASATLEEALKAWSRFDIPGKKEITKARIQRAVQLYMQPDMRSERKIADRMKVTPKQVSTWFKAFTKATGFKVVTHKKNESVRNHTHGPKHQQNRKTVLHGEDTSDNAQNEESTEDPFFSER